MFGSKKKSSTKPKNEKKEKNEVLLDKKYMAGDYVQSTQFGYTLWHFPQFSS